MTLVQVLQKLRDDLMQWGTANFEQINTNFTSLNSKISNLQGSSTTNLSDLEKRVSTNETNIASNDSDITALDERVTVNEDDIDNLEAKTEYIDGTDDSALFIIDKDENVVAYFDANGLHTTDIEAQNLSLRDGITQNGEQFFIIDKDENVAAYIDGEGTHVTNLYVAGDAEVDGNLNVAGNITIDGDFKATNIEATETVKANQVEVATGIIQDGEDKFFIIDSKEQVAAYIDGEGTHVTNLYADKNLEITGSSTLNNILSVAGKTTLNDKLEVAGKTTLNSDLYVEKETDTNTLNVRSTSNLIGNLTVQANTDLNGTLNVDGHTTATTLTASGNVNIGGDLEVTGTFKSANLDATDNDSFFIIDKDTNVVAYFNAGGLYITDVTTKGIKLENGSYISTTVQNGAENYSVNQTLVDLLNKAIDYSNRITTIEGTLSIVSNVMDFIGVFQTLELLEAYATPNPGDVAVVVENQTEYIYDETLGWVEFGYSSYTMDKLIELEERLDAEIDDRTNADRAINYLGDFVASTDISSPERGDIAVIGGFLQRYTGTAWESFNGLSKKLYYLNGEESEKAFFTAQDETVVCYIDATGLHVTDIFAKTYLNVEGGATINGATVLGNALTVHGNTDLQYTLTVADEATFSSLVTANGKQTVDGISNIGLKVTEGITAKNLNIDNQTVTTTLQVSSNATIEDLDVTTNTDIGGELKVTGNTTINGETGLTVKNTATIGETNSANTNLTVNGDSQFNGDLTATGAIQTNSLNVTTTTTTTNLNVNENINVSGALNVTGNITTNSNVIIDGDISSKNFSSEDSDAVYFVDNTGDTVGVYIDGTGLHAHTFEAQQITTRYKDDSGTIHSTTNSMTNIMYFDVEDEVTVTF